MVWGGYHSRECRFGDPHLTCTDGCYSRQDELRREWEAAHGPSPELPGEKTFAPSSGTVITPEQAAAQARRSTNPLPGLLPEPGTSEARAWMAPELADGCPPCPYQWELDGRQGCPTDCLNRSRR